MVLNRLQQALQTTYDVSIPHQVEDFLFHDAELAHRLSRGAAVAAVPEQLFVVQDDEALNVSLYLERQVDRRLRRDDPLTRLHLGNFQDFLLALEGVSHFLYLAWNAGNEKVITLLELELQAEVDKFVTALVLWRHQYGGRPANALWRHLFGPLRLREDLDPGQRERYALAHRYGARYCRALARRVDPGRRGLAALDAELRRFYRMTQPQKLAHIRQQSH